MKKLIILTTMMITTSVFADIKIGFVSLKRCMDESQLGQRKTQEMEALRKKFVQTSEEIEKELTAIYEKLQDAEYMESISEESALELQKKFESLSGEYQAYQGQYYQFINQSNYKNVQELIEAVKVASECVREKLGYDVILNEESVLTIIQSADITNQVIQQLDINQEGKE